MPKIISIVVVIMVLASFNTEGLIYPLRLAKKPLNSGGKQASSVDQEAIINQLLVTDAALRLRKGEPVDEAEFNKFLIGCVGRFHDHGVVELIFDSGMKALACAGDDGPFFMRMVGFNPKHIQKVAIGTTPVWYAQDGAPIPGGGGGGAKVIEFDCRKEDVGRKMKLLRQLMSQV